MIVWGWDCYEQDSAVSKCGFAAGHTQEMRGTWLRRPVRGVMGLCDGSNEFDNICLLLLVPSWLWMRRCWQNCTENSTREGLLLTMRPTQPASSWHHRRTFFMGSSEICAYSS